jgi:hypothetical protein
VKRKNLTIHEKRNVVVGERGEIQQNKNRSNIQACTINRMLEAVLIMRAAECHKWTV